MTGIEFDIGDRVYAWPDKNWWGFFIGTVIEVYETFGNRNRRFKVWLDAQDGERWPDLLTPEQQRLGYVFGDWQLEHIGGGL